MNGDGVKLLAGRISAPAVFLQMLGLDEDTQCHWLTMRATRNNLERLKNDEFESYSAIETIN